MEILVSAELDYFEPLATMLYSLFFNNKNVDRVFIFTQANEAELSEIIQLCQIYGVKLKIIHPPEADLGNLPSRIHGVRTDAMYYRLQAASLIPINIQRVIYLDADLIVRKSLDPLWSTPIDGNYLAASTLHASMKDRTFSNKFGGRYFNSGVMLLNLELWRSKDIYKKILKFMNESADLVRYHDQCVLNYVCRPFKEINPTWNYNQSVNARHAKLWGLTPEELTNIGLNPAIAHFIGPDKPWRRSRDDVPPLQLEYFIYNDAMKARLLDQMKR